MSTKTIVTIAVLLAGAPVACAQLTLAEWTFETSLPTTSGPHAAEGGVYGGSAFAVTGGTISNPVGNGTPESLSSNAWNAGDYFEFRTSSIGYAGLSFSWSQSRTPTGPGLFDLAISTDGVNFATLLSSYSVRVLSSPGWSSPGTPVALDQFSVGVPSSYDNQSMLIFRLVSLQDAPVSGTNRVDTVALTVPAQNAVAILGLGGLMAARRRRTVRSTF